MIEERRDIKSVTLQELQRQLQRWQSPAYRAIQVLEWVYRMHAHDWEEMTNVPKDLRTRLAETYSFLCHELVRRQGSHDTTQKFLWRLRDGALVESVLIPASPSLYGEPSDRHTLCVSTQVGCAYGCKFCASGLDGWKRNLLVEEIVDQVFGVERWHTAQTDSTKEQEAKGRDGPSTASRSTGPNQKLINNLVIMGMGEPLANYPNLLNALKILNAPWGGGIGARKITISTSGLAPQIRRLADEPVQFRLAISLHGATDDVRNRIMPINRRFPLSDLMAACEFYQRKKGRMLTFEYILIAGVNDGIEQAAPLAKLAQRLHAKVNLIPYNPVAGLPWQRPVEAVQEAFLHALERLKITTTLRREKGTDIDAACGQLRLTTERENFRRMGVPV